MITEKQLKKLPNCYSIFLKTTPEKHLKSYNILKALPKKGVIFTTTRPADNLAEILKSKLKGKDIYFVDCISKCVGYKKKYAKAVYLESPESLTEISLAIRKILNKMQKENNFLIFDSLSKLTFYQNANTLFRFMNSLVNMCRATNTKLIILGIEEDLPRGLKNNIEEMCDKVVKVK